MISNCQMLLDILYRKKHVKYVNITYKVVIQHAHQVKIQLVVKHVHLYVLNMITIHVTTHMLILLIITEQIHVQLLLIVVKYLRRRHTSMLHTVTQIHRHIIYMWIKYRNHVLQSCKWKQLPGLD